MNIINGMQNKSIAYVLINLPVFKIFGMSSIQFVRFIQKNQFNFLEFKTQIVYLIELFIYFKAHNNIISNGIHVLVLNAKKWYTINCVLIIKDELYWKEFVINS